MLDSLAATLTPLALVAVCYAIRLDRIVRRLAPLAAGLGCRLAIAPLAMLGPSVAMGMTRDLVAFMIGIGIPLSIVSAPFWWWLSDVV